MLKNNRKQIEQKITSQIEDGLNDAAQIYTNAMKRALRGGYTSGDFTTGNLLNSVTRTPVTQEGKNFSVRVGTNLEYAVFWEVGHHNIFTRKYEREERWRPTLLDNLNRMRSAIRNSISKVK